MRTHAATTHMCPHTHTHARNTHGMQVECSGSTHAPSTMTKAQVDEYFSWLRSDDAAVQQVKREREREREREYVMNQYDEYFEWL